MFRHTKADEIAAAGGYSDSVMRSLELKRGGT
jgi:hypothetical protein